MIVPAPVSTPDTTPEEETLAVELLLLQVPPAVASLNEVLEPTHRLPTPIIAEGKGLTVTSNVAGLHANVVYDTTTIPEEIPVTTPEELIVASPEPLARLHAPGLTPSGNIMLLFTHTEDG